MAGRTRVLVTGGAGYVGLPLATALSRRYEVLVADVRAPDGFRGWGRGTGCFERADVCDAEQMEEICSRFRPRVVYHLAAIHFIPHCEAEPQEAFRVNVCGTRNVLAAARGAARIILASSAAVYRPSSAALSELAPVGPNDVYGATKLAAEAMVREHARETGAFGVCARLFNVVGGADPVPHLVPALLSGLREGKTLLGVGTLSTRRSYVDRRDVVRALLRMASRPAPRRGRTLAINVGGPAAESVARVVHLLAEVTGTGCRAVEEPARARPVDRPVLRADVRRAAQLLGWRPRYRLRDALADAWATPSPAA